MSDRVGTPCRPDVLASRPDVRSFANTSVGYNGFGHDFRRAALDNPESIFLSMGKKRADRRYRQAVREGSMRA
jgi:hypothetical protein